MTRHATTATDLQKSWIPYLIIIILIQKPNTHSTIVQRVVK